MRQTVFVLIILFIVSCGSQNDTGNLVSYFGNTMGTTYSIKIVDKDKNKKEVLYSALQQRIDSLLQNVNQQMSTYIKDSEISRFNNSKSTDWFKISDDFAKVLKEAKRIGILTGGALDITVGALVNLWGFGPGNTERLIPDETKIEQLKKLIGLDKIEVNVDPPEVRKSAPGLYIDLSSIAKGFGVDKVADFLDQLEIKNYMVEIGGEVKTSGHNSSGSFWKIGISTPDGSGGIEKIITLNNISIATSGDYRNYFEENGKRFSHTIDPRTGKPIEHNLASVTVVHPSCMTADGLATAFDVLGPEEGFKLAEKLELPVFMIVRKENGFVEKQTKQFSEILKNSLSVN